MLEGSGVDGFDSAMPTDFAFENDWQWLRLCVLAPIAFKSDRNVKITPTLKKAESSSNVSTTIFKSVTKKVPSSPIKTKDSKKQDSISVAEPTLPVQASPKKSRTSSNSSLSVLKPPSGAKSALVTPRQRQLQYSALVRSKNTAVPSVPKDAASFSTVKETGELPGLIAPYFSKIPIKGMNFNFMKGNFLLFFFFSVPSKSASDLTKSASALDSSQLSASDFGSSLLQFESGAGSNLVASVHTTDGGASESADILPPHAATPVSAPTMIAAPRSALRRSTSVRQDFSFSSKIVLRE